MGCLGLAKVTIIVVPIENGHLSKVRGGTRVESSLAFP